MSTADKETLGHLKDRLQSLLQFVSNEIHLILLPITEPMQHYTKHTYISAKEVTVAKFFQGKSQ